MDDGGRCLLDVINDPQLLQTFLENSSNETNTSRNTQVSKTEQNQHQPVLTATFDQNIKTISTINSSISGSETVLLNSSIITNKLSNSTFTVNTNQINPSAPSTNFSNPVLTKKASKSKSHSKSINVQGKTNQLDSQNLSTNLSTVLNPNKYPMTISGFNNGMITNLQLQALPNPNNIRQIVSTNSVNQQSMISTFSQPSTVQMGPRPVTVLPQQFFLPGTVPINQPNTLSTQFVLATRPQTPNQTVVNHINPQPGQILQIIQTSQGTQLIQQPSFVNSSTTLPTLINTTKQSINSALISSISTTNVNPTIFTSQPSLTVNNNLKSPATNKKQLLPKIDQAKINKSNSLIIASSVNPSLQNANIKSIQNTGNDISTATATNTIQKPWNVTNSAQILLAPGTQQPGIISGPNGTFLVNNILPNTHIGSSPIVLQNNVPNQFTLKPQTPLFINPTNALNQPQNNLNLTTLTADKSTGQVILNQSNPVVNQVANRLVLNTPSIRSTTPTNIVLRPQTSTSASPLSNSIVNKTNQTPQLIQIQTANGPMLISLNLNQQTQPQPPSQNRAINLNQPQINPTQNSQPQTIQIGNTVYTLPPNANIANGSNLSSLISSGPSNLSIQSNQPQLSEIRQSIVSQQSTTTSLFVNSNGQLTIAPSQQPAKVNPLPKSNSTTKKKNQSKSKTVSNNPPQPKALNLADLLKETGILTEFSPPSSPNSSQTVGDNKDLSTHNKISENKLDQKAPLSQIPQSTTSSQSSVLTLSTQQNSTASSQLKISNTASSIQSKQQSSPINHQFRLSLTSDGQIILLSPNSSNLFGNNPIPPLATIVKNVNSSTSNLTSNKIISNDSNSSQPSPDSTTPSIDGFNNSILLSSNKTSLSLSTNDCKSPIANGSENIPPVTKINCQTNLTETSLNVPTNTSTSPAINSASISSNLACPSSTSASTTTTITTANLTVSTSPKITMTPSSTMTTILVPGTIMFINENRVPYATYHRNCLPELLALLDQQIKSSQCDDSLKNLTTEMKNLQNYLEIIKSQNFLPTQIPQVKISAQIAKIFQNHRDNKERENAVQLILSPNGKSQTNPIHLIHTNSKLVGLVPSKISPVPNSSTKSVLNEGSQMIQDVASASKTISINVLDNFQDKKQSQILKAIQSQLHADQNSALNPDCRTNFRNRDDACKRLLRYHIFDHPNFTCKKIKQFDENFEKLSVHLLERKNELYNKFRMLMFKESMCDNSSSENVMISRLLIEDEKNTFESEKGLIASGCEKWLKRVSKESELDDLIFNKSLSNSSEKDPMEDTSKLNTMNSDPFSDIYNFNDLCDMFEDDGIVSQNSSQNHASSYVSINENQINNHNVVDDLIKHLNSPLNPEEKQSLPDNFSLKANDDVNCSDDLNAVPLNQNDFLMSDTTQTLINNETADALIADDDLDLIYEKITSETWSNQSSSTINNRQTTASFNDTHQIDLFCSNSTVAWTSRYDHMNETEAAVAVQSIIDDRNLLEGVNKHSNNFDEDNLININDGTQNLSLDLAQDTIADAQMNSAIKSIMLTSPISHQSCNTFHLAHSNNESENSAEMMNESNEFDFNLGHDSHHNHHHDLLRNHFGSSHHQSHLNDLSLMNAYGTPNSSSAIINDPMLDEAVKSIL
ncbi:hypothetical protein QR98_0094530 [Sarcoptes scabiei]|uniref:GLTSCR protein conserved domain-containing protein n=1 Tax=Sarcoptes scabiei TaxID=52283 RepID=A0A132AIQ8_SARSC|nr:hypothetical protein QR98_0094530 [Sarcoptes scabiei]